MKGYLRNVALGIVVGLSIGMLLGSVRSAKAHDHNNPEQDEWYHSLMQPDAPSAPCCGTADAYWADEIHVRNGKTYATITDDREDGPLGRPHIDVGTVFEVPDNKLKWDRSNPTGHTIIFLSGAGYVFCFVQGTGI